MAKMTTQKLKSMKEKGEKFAQVTAYDYPTALLVDRAGIETILVGDSLGMTVLGYESTVPVTMDDMVHHIRAVVRGAKNPLIVGDMPYGSYHESRKQAVRNAVRLMKEGGCDAVKLEGGREIAETVKAIVDAGIPVNGHIGLTPQKIAQLGGFKVQGKSLDSAKALIEDAKALEEAGAFTIVIECVPEALGKYITEMLSIPTIGIGGGRYTDGQVLVFHDLMGLFDRFTPKFVKKYVNLGEEVVKALEAYKAEVKECSFPGPEHIFGGVEEEDLKRLY